MTIKISGITLIELYFSVTFVHFEFKWADNFIVANSTYGSKLSTHELFCVCKLAMFRNMYNYILLQFIHVHWRRLLLFVHKMNQFLGKLKQFLELDMARKITLKTKFHKLAFIDNASMCPPLEKVKTKKHQNQQVVELKTSLFIDNDIKVRFDKWMTILDKGYIIVT
ncbi:hypothetical protein CR513_20961, partial [Mucuna pruriens]